MKELWIEIPEDLPTIVKSNLLEAASEAADVLLVSSRDSQAATKSGKTLAGAFDSADIKIVNFQKAEDITSAMLGDKVAARVIISRGEDEAKAENAANIGASHIILKCTDWKTIPLENLIAKLRGRSRIIVEVESPEEAKVALETLQLGADGILYRPKNREEISRIKNMVRKPHVKITLSEAEIVSIKPLGVGARACIDTCDLLKPREGLLVGSQSSGLFLVESETMENPHVEPRPFRVNAGSVASYILVSPEKTKYLSELKCGDEVMVIDFKGETRMVNICRVKIEWRPMIMLTAKSGGRSIHVILQNAETIRLVTSQGSISVSEVKPGCKVLVRSEVGGRHFGTLVEEESVIER
ncbi:MAG: 3-dehydroquinate synthase II [Candidatus Bathyarchaeia archaeon]